MKNAREIFSLFANKYSTFCHIVAYVPCFCIVTLVAIIMVDVLGRQLFHWTTLIGDQLQGLLVPVVCFLGLTEAMRSNTHPRIIFAVGHLPCIIQKWFRLIAIITAGVYLWFIIDYSWATTATSYIGRQVTVSVRPLPVFIFNVAIPIGAALLLGYLVIDATQLVLSILNPRRHI